MNVVSIDSGFGLANATIQQRLVPVRLFYDHLMADGVRDSNPVGRGRYIPGRRRGRHQRGLHGTAGSASGRGKRTGSNPGTAPQADSTSQDRGNATRSVD